MNRDDIIRMAREAGALQIGFNKTIMQSEYSIFAHELEIFFHMAQAAMIEQGWRQCAEGQRTTQFCGMVEQAVQAEREACINIIETYRIPVGNSAAGEMACEWTYDALKEIRDAIRVRNSND